MPSGTSGAGALFIYDLRGQLIEKQSVMLSGSSLVTWDISQSIASGFYVAVVDVAGVMVTKRFRVR